MRPGTPALLLPALLLALLVAAPARARVYERCELARELASVHGVPRDQLAVWVCIARHESDFNTTAVGHVGEGGDHGIFQISDLYWCSHSAASAKACGVTCAQLLDDNIGDDMACAKRIHREHQGLSGNGFNAWAVYPLYCKHPDRAAKYLDGCFSGTGNDIEPQAVYGLPPPAITAPPPRGHPAPSATTTTTPTPTLGSRALWQLWQRPAASSRSFTHTQHRFSVSTAPSTQHRLAAPTIPSLSRLSAGLLPPRNTELRPPLSRGSPLRIHVTSGTGSTCLEGAGFER